MRGLAGIDILVLYPLQGFSSISPVQEMQMTLTTTLTLTRTHPNHSPNSNLSTLRNAGPSPSTSPSSNQACQLLKDPCTLHCKAACARDGMCAWAAQKGWCEACPVEHPKGGRRAEPMTSVARKPMTSVLFTLGRCVPRGSCQLDVHFRTDAQD